MTAERAVRIHRGVSFSRIFHRSDTFCGLECSAGGDRNFIAIPDTPATRAVIEEARESIKMFYALPGENKTRFVRHIRALLSLLETEEE